MMETLRALGIHYWDLSVEYFCVIFEWMNQIIGWQLSVVVTVIAVTASLWYCWRRKSIALKPLEIIGAQLGAQVNWPGHSEGSRYRFRKRDRVMFYGRRMLRKVKSFSHEAYGGQGRKRRAVMRFAKRILQLQSDNAPTMLKVNEPPAIFLEETIDLKQGVPADALYMLENIRIFGHFDKPVFLKLCKYTEVLRLESGEWLFRVGDVDESVFIVQKGQINVLVNNPDGSTMVLKTIKKGESVTSLLSFIDVWSGTPSQYKTVQARAIEPTSVIKLPMTAFQEIFAESPDILVRVIQVIMLRLERVTFTALRHYLGLHAELAFQGGSKKKGPTKGSPGHQRSNSNYLELGNIMTQSAHSNQSAGGEIRPDITADINPSGEYRPENRKSSASMSYEFEKDLDKDGIYKALAVEGFLKELGLTEDDKDLLEQHILVKDCTPGLTLVTEGEVEEVSLFYVISGSLVVQQTVTSSLGSYSGLEKQEAHIMTVHPGELEGGLAVITGEASLYTIRAKHFARVAILERQVVYQIMRERPNIVLDIANSVVKKLSPLVRQCDFALDWVFLESGRAVFRQDEPSDSTYIVLSGRLRSVATHQNGKKEIVGEFGKGDLVGIVEMITDTVRSNTAMAVRDSELAKLPQGLFNAIKLRHPAIVTQLFGLLSHRMLGNTSQHGLGRTQLDSTYPTMKYTTVAIVAVNDDVPLTAFTYELYHSLSAVGPTLRLTSDAVRKTLGPTIMDSTHEYRLTSWLAQQEDRHKICLYQCDNNLTQWTQRCWRQADCIIIVGVNDHGPSVGNIEREIDRLMLRTQKELVILHKENAVAPQRPANTVQWLNMRSWVTKHHHIVCPKRMFTRKSQYRVNDLYSKVLMSEPNIHSDFSRLARWLTGNSVGLVLGGGGARGAAHVGMLKAIQEAGIPIDMVGGVSIGAFMGALWCSEKNITSVTQKARAWCKKMTNWGRQLLDLTYPITSMFSGRDFNKTIRDTFGDAYIEDLWIPYFTLTTDITASCARIHTHGSLWRYVRASMSLSGYMPPLCDPTDGHLLLDGGYVNNLPANVMRSLGAAHIIAVDVGSQDETNLTAYGDHLSGWWLLYKRFNPFSSPVKVPDLPDIQSRLAYVSCVRQLEEVKSSDYCEYVRPPIDQYKTLAFGSFDTIKEVGYKHGKNYFENMASTGRISRFNNWSAFEASHKSPPHTLNDYTFTDLAQIVCRIPETYPDNHYSSSDDEYYDGYISEPSTLHMKAKNMFRMKRTGGSLSLSENEIDSDDLEMPVPLNFTEKTRERLNSVSKSTSSATTTPSSTQTKDEHQPPKTEPEKNSPAQAVLDSTTITSEDYVEMVK